MPYSLAEYALANSVLMRDRTKTQYLVLPLAAGILARCVLARSLELPVEDDLSEVWPHWESSARELLARCDSAEDEQWATDADRYGLVADFAHAAWPAFLRWSPLAWVYRTLDLSPGAPPGARVDTIERWLRAKPDRSLVHSMIVAAYGFSVAARPNELALYARSAQRLRVTLAERLRSAGLTSWPRVVRAASDEWNVATLEGLATEFAETCNLLLVDALSLEPDTESLDDDGLDDGAADDPFGNGAPPVDRPAPVEALRPAHETAMSGHPPGDSAALESAMHRVRSLEAENDRLVEKVTRLQKERDQHVDRHAGAESRAEALKVELVASRAEIDDLELKLLMANRARQELEDQIAVDESLAEGAPPPADCFAGRRILLFTGAQAADTREAMRSSFFEFGAQQVDCYYIDKDRGPDSYPQGSLVVVDVTYMPHTVRDPIVNRARTSGVRCFPCRRGASLIAQEVAARLQLPTRPG